MANCYVALFNKDGEVKKSDYARAIVKQWTFNKNYSISNSNLVVFNTVQSDWGKITHFALCSERVGGRQYAKRNIKRYKPMPIIEIGYSYSFPIGELKIIFEGDMV